MDPQQRQAALIHGLQDPARYPQPVTQVEHRETHISHVLLAGDYAYKIKKPLDLGFLDFSSLAQRRFYCREEVRLNARLAPSIYLDVVPITGTPDDPRIDGAGAAIEYAVRMRRFDDGGLLDRLLDRGAVGPELIDEAAHRIAAFHDAAAVSTDRTWGTAAAVLAPARENFDQIEARTDDPDDMRRLQALRHWTEESIVALDDTLARRRAQGRIRECHGDMHLGNMALQDDELIIFDGIEFNENLRWIDVASDVAFLVMDLDRRHEVALASRFLDRWLAATGDYDALAVLRFYLVYRAIVRAKIAAIRLAQDVDTAERTRLHERFRGYLELAERYAAAWAPAVFITRGVAGSGKSTAAEALVERLGAARVRSDIERRRLFPDPDPAVRYAVAAHDAVYARLEAIAARAVAAGFPVVVDATFLERDRRTPFARLAERCGAPFRILDLDLSDATLEQRVRARQQAGTDASEADVAVMTRQRERIEPLTTSERNQRTRIDNTGGAPVVPATGLAHARGFGRDDTE